MWYIAVLLLRCEGKGDSACEASELVRCYGSKPGAHSLLRDCIEELHGKGKVHDDPHAG